MLFAMGVGSRISKYIKTPLFDVFIGVELALSLLCGISAISSYFLSAYTQYVGLYIYAVSFAIGILIGLEIPIATRLNESYQELRLNISSVMEHDYYGALLGGVLFAFVALPYLGLTYTPIVLGAINLAVATIFFIQFRGLTKNRKLISGGFLVVPALLALLAFLAEPVVLFSEQQNYRDKVVFQQQTPYQRIVLTRWKDHHWLYINGNEQFSSFDEERYHEPLVHPAMYAAASTKHILILGGGDGLAVREILKHDGVEKITLVDLDPAMTTLGKENPLFVQLNKNSMNDGRVHIENKDAHVFLRETNEMFDVIIIDLPDPNSVDLARLYTRQFYTLAGKHLSSGGAMVTQATSPFFSRKAFLSILKTMRSSGLPAAAYHNHIPTLGEWGWVLGIKAPATRSDSSLSQALSKITVKHPMRFLNDGTLNAMFQFGNETMRDFDQLNINDELDLSTYHYYRNGEWDFY